MEGNTRPINIFSLIFTDELAENLVEWTNSNYAQKKRLQPDKHRMKWTDTYPVKFEPFCCTRHTNLLQHEKSSLCITRERNCYKDHHTKVEFWK